MVFDKDDGFFTINGKREFLLGISYYAALEARNSFITADLDDMQRYGFNWIRVWTTWEKRIFVVNPDGAPDLDKLKALVDLVVECDRRDIVVDVTFVQSRESFPTAVDLLPAIRQVVSVLAPYRNAYIDPCNEHDVRWVDFSGMRSLVDTIHAEDPNRLAAVSYWIYDTSREAVKLYDELVKPDILAPHLPRYPGCAQQTEGKIRALRSHLEQLSLVWPIHLQEPFRRGFRVNDYEPSPEDFLQDLRGAVKGGAAGWCYHNGDQKDRSGGHPMRSFDLREKRLFDQLDKEDMGVVERLAEIVN